MANPNRREMERKVANQDLPWDPWAMPSTPPQYQDIWTNGMALSPYVDSQLSGVDMDKRGLSRFREEALRQGPSAWARLAKQQQTLGAEDARTRLSQEAAGRTAGARTQMAMRGGLDSGARERIAQSGARDYLLGAQGISRQGLQNNMQIDMNDETNRIQQLGMLPGMEAQAAGFDLSKAQTAIQGRQQDVLNQMKNLQGRNDWKQNQWNTQMGAWAAGRQATATENAGKK